MNNIFLKKTSFLIDLKENKIIAGTQKLQCFIPISNNSLKVSEYSKSKKFRQEKVVFAQHEQLDGQLAGFVTARYNDQL